MKINLSECYTNNDEVRSITKVLKSGWLTSGKLTEEFENISKKKLKCKYAIATNSCTNGINSVLHASGLKKGDEVITSPLTFISTINNLYNFGLKIKFVDIDKSNYSIDIKKLKKSITKKTKCILVTHYGGVPCDIRKILEFIKKKNIFLVEDAATAFGSKINNKFIGSFKDSCAIFSFYPNKIITTGEGGLICTNNKTLAKKIRTNISCGIDKTPFARLKNKEPFKYDVTYPGFKYNFTDLQAALGIQQIKKIEKIIKYRKELRQKYYFHLKDLHSKDIISFLKIPKNFRSSEYIFTILLNPKKISCTRNDLALYLNKKKIGCTVHYLTFDNLSFYKNKYSNKNLKINKYVCKNILSLPFHNNLSKNNISTVCKYIKIFLKKHTK